MRKRTMYIVVISLLVVLMFNTVAQATENTRIINTRGIAFNSGRSSDNIRLLKDFFRARGAKDVPWGYDYDSKTKELVRAFQKEKGLGADGIAGDSTIKKINEEILQKNYKIGLRQPTVKQKGDLILINKSSNTLHLMRNGKVFKSYPVATGKTQALTPDGRHKVVIKLVNPAWGGAGVSAPIAGGAPNNPLGTRWIGISYGGGGSYGMHGNSNPSSIGRYASLGCVRMFNSGVEDLYNHVKIGTPVWIGEEGLLEKYGVSFDHNFGNYKPTVKPVEPKPDYILSKAQVKIDGRLVNLEKSIINKDGTTYYPFREILEEVGAEVLWDEKSNTAIGNLETNTVMFQIGKNDYLVNGSPKFLPKGQKSFINKGNTYVPIRYLMEGLGYKVNWDQATRTISIDKEEVTESIFNYDKFIEQDLDYESL